jgi:proteasome lid subunit RPN8/RPN11
MSTIILELEHRRDIATRGEAAYPRICRGLLLGHRNGATSQVIDIVFGDDAPQPESQEERVQLAYQEMPEGEAIAGDRGLEVLGSFHSCVNRPARPSLEDRETAQPKRSVVIVGIREGRAHELTAWELSEDRSVFAQLDMRRP